ncbi:MAG: SDR family NAD(P)-dependent oxidoreductase [Bacteroidota bacterium]
MKKNISATFKDKTVIISGSSKGIGKVLARELGLLGANIVLNGTNEQVLNATNRELELLGINTIAVAGSVTELDTCNRIVKEALKKYDSIDIVVANAGMSAEGSLEESDPLVFKKIMEVNYLGTVYLIKACLPGLKITGGSILMTGSVSGFRGMPGYAAYSAAKMALTALAGALNIELKSSGISVGIAYVGFTQNDDGKMMLDSNGTMVSKKKIARGKVATQLEVATSMITMLKKHQFKKVFSTLGVITDLVVRFAPSLGSFILERNFQERTVPEKTTPLLEYPFT